MDKFFEVLPIIISLFALAISFLNYINERRNRISGIISADRIKWISDVRELMSCFLKTYIEREEDKLKGIKSKIDLYIIYDSDEYKKFEEKLNYCTLHPYTDKDCRELIEKTQIVLNRAWRRIKDEAGISKREEKRIRKIMK